MCMYTNICMYVCHIYTYIYVHICMHMYTYVHSMPRDQVGGLVLSRKQCCFLCTYRTHESGRLAISNHFLFTYSTHEDGKPVISNCFHVSRRPSFLMFRDAHPVSVSVEKLVFPRVSNVFAWISNVSWHAFSFTWLTGHAKFMILLRFSQVAAKPSFSLFIYMAETLIWLRVSTVFGQRFLFTFLLGTTIKPYVLCICIHMYTYVHICIPCRP